MENSSTNLRNSLRNLGDALVSACHSLAGGCRRAFSGGGLGGPDGRIDTLEEQIVNRMIAALPDVLAQYEFVIIIRPKEKSCEK